ncbi:uncharacterized protein LOC126614585 [Malus sylvestris]|uniref:uncharacterized protein LOC126614585 n=1 Tax=Malus sylvestris TaxID=3752 RepID=UPI0021ABDC5A|nr:uncharacterized protein LOC126614585 [Malus sylvestris]
MTTELEVGKPGWVGAQENNVEAPEEFPKKAKLFFARAAEIWNAEFYSKFNDDVYATVGQYYHLLHGHDHFSICICMIIVQINSDLMQIQCESKASNAIAQWQSVHGKSMVSQLTRCSLGFVISLLSA